MALAAPILGLAAASASAATPQLDTSALSADQCTQRGTNAKLVVDVSFVLDNYADSGYAGEWAVDTVNRHLKIWHHADGTYCAQIRDNGSKFVTLAGPSPTGDGSVDAGITGTFDGGYITTDIVGKLAPTYPEHGKLGTFDAKCDATFTCSGAYPTWLSYFKNPTANAFAEWGWLYDAGKYGTWLDQDNTFVLHDGDIRT